jgi:molybdenum cofactor cytidylyltransferase
MLSAIITAAGKNRRMIKDQKARGMKLKHKLLLDLDGKPVIVRTIENVLKTGVDECVVVLGHFSADIKSVLDSFPEERFKILENPEINVELSETLLNGISNVKPGLCLCVAADQPTVSGETLGKLLKIALEYSEGKKYSEGENIVSILAREESGYLKSTEGLGMPFVCHSHLLEKYLPDRDHNLNPILGDMLADGVVFYGVPPRDELELVNINQWDDYILVSKSGFSG